MKNILSFKHESTAQEQILPIVADVIHVLLLH